MGHNNRTEFEKPWLYEGKPALVAHRGDAQNCPENTLAALESAVSAGAKYLEFDIQFSQDAVPFLLHDATLARTAGVDERSIDLDMDDILNISVGEAQRFGDKFSNEKPVTLRGLCAFLNGLPDVHSFIEVKRHSVEHFGVEKAVGRVLESIDTLTSPHTIISFRDDVLFEVKAKSDCSIGWVIREWNDESFAVVEKLQPEYLFVNFEKIPKGDTLPKLGAAWVLYDIKTAWELMHCYRLGTDMIESMSIAPMMNSMR